MSPTEVTFQRLGELIERLLIALTLAHTGWSMGRARNHVAQYTDYSESMVYRWREGRSRPHDEALEKLARLGKEEANLPRSWGEEMLYAARYPEADRLVNELWGARQLRVIPSNLPAPTYTTFVGRQAEVTRLLELLSPRHAAHLISIDGIGGVGKTALVLEVAYRCLRASTGESPNHRVPVFDAIIFVSAKQEVLTPGGILARTHTQRTLQDIFREVGDTLDRGGVTRVTLEEQPAYVRQVLADQNTLLIVDNLETMEDKQGMMGFLYDLPPQVKVIITTRERALLYAPIRLENLPQDDGLQLIQHEAADKDLALDHEQTLAIYQRTGGVPAAMIYAVGQMAAGYSLETMLIHLAEAKGDVARFCFEGSVAPLRGQPAHSLLMAMAMFPTNPLRDAVVHVAGLAADPIGADEGLTQLKRLSLIRQQETQYGMLPLTREYASAELVVHPDFEREARKRWVAWHLSFAREYGGRDWHEWHIQYDRLEEEWGNLLAVFDWCAAQDRYEDIKAFWKEPCVSGFASIYGYWNDRLIWLDWLIQASERRGDWPTAVEAISDMGWTLTLMGTIECLKTADELFERAWDVHTYADLSTQCELANNRAVLRLRQMDYAGAQEWLDVSESLWEQTLDQERDSIRRWIAIIYYRAEVCFRTGDFNQAQVFYRKMLEHSQAIGWERAIVYAQNWLADIAIMQGELDEAARLLQAGLLISERNMDKRRTAFYKRSFARLEQARGNVTEVRRWATEALDGFDRLGMQPEAEEMQRLLESLGATER
jgi:hypothetical protein